MGTEELIKKLDNKDLLDSLYGFAYKRCNNSHEADDLCSDILVEILKSIHKGADIIKFNAFIWTIAHRTYADFCEKRRVLSERLVSEEYFDDTIQIQTDPFDDFIESEADRILLHKIRKEISFLSRIYRDVFVLYYLDDMKTSEIAKTLDISETNVKQRLFSARNFIKKEVEKMDGKHITLKPISISFLGTGNPVGNDPRVKAERIFSQNLVYLCKDTARSAKELSELLDVPMLYIEEELDIQCHGANGQYGLLRKLENGKYISNFIIVDNEDYAQVHEIFKMQVPLITKRIRDYLAKSEEHILSFPFLNEQKDIKFITWSLILRMTWSYSEKVYQAMRENFMPDIEIIKRDFSVLGIASKNNETVKSGFYGSDGNRSLNICGYKSILFANIYGEHIEKHFSCGHNISFDPLLLLTVKSIGGIAVESLSEDEKENAAKAIECGYIKKQDGILTPKILILDRIHESDFYNLAFNFEEDIIDLAKEAATLLYAQVKRIVPKHLINEYNIFVTLSQSGCLSSNIIEQCIKEGILNAPENSICAEGTWMIVEKDELVS